MVDFFRVRVTGRCCVGLSVAAIWCGGLVVAQLPGRECVEGEIGIYVAGPDGASQMRCTTLECTNDEVSLFTIDPNGSPVERCVVMPRLKRKKPRPSFPADEAYRNIKTSLHYPFGDILVLVDDDVYTQVSASIDQYVLDIGRDGYWGTIHVVQGGTPTQVRSYIRERSPVGVLLVGGIPAPWFELDNDFHGVHSEFPCDLYYMDTNGTWHDPDGDGKFSDVTGNMDPEIWVGRIWTPTSNGNDGVLINDYFARNHDFRLGMLGHARSALAFVDDDWVGFDDCAFDEQFPSSVITKYTNPNVTDADLYKAEVNTLRSWVQLCAHSSTHSHALWVPSQNQNEYIQVAYFRDTNPPNSHFYNLF